MLTRSLLALSLASLLSATAAAQTPVPDGAETFAAELDPVMVTATRRASEALTTPASINIIDDSALKQNMVSDFRELFRYEPGIAVKPEPRGRGGEAGIEIRGIGGQRLVMLVDGVRQPNGYVAAGADLGMLKLDPASLKRVEVLRGPASSLYGSDALAGVVLFHTPKASDVLGLDDRFKGQASLGHHSASDSQSAQASLAFRAGRSQHLVATSYRRGHALENHGGAIKPDPQHTRTRTALVKSEVELADGHTLTFTGEHYQQHANTDQVSLARVVAGGIRINQSLADDASTRSRVGLAYQWQPDQRFFDRLSTQLDYQRSASKERSFEDRKPPGAAPARLRDGVMSYREPQWSGSLQLDGHVETGALEHRWIAGMDLLSQSVEQFNMAVERNQNGGNASNVVDGETYPRRTAPDTDVRNIGLFAHDEMVLMDGRLAVSPSLRYDAYRLSPKPDALYANANVAGNVPVKLSKSALTPRLGATFEWRPRQVLYASLVTGFRMPTPAQLNRTGQVPVATFIHDFIPSPNLKPERSKGAELGLRGESSRGSYELTGFYNHYSDFIDTQMIAFIPANTPANPGARSIRRFQSRNVGKVNIYGIEAKGSLALHHWFNSADHWHLIAASQWSMGNDKSNRQPLNSIQPFKLVTGLRWEEAEGRFGGQLMANVVSAKTRVNRQLAQTGPVAPVPLTTAGYTTLDLTLNARLGQQARVYLGFHNLMDRRYYDWSRVSGLTGNDPRLPAYTAPGRSVSARVEVGF